MSSWRQLGLLVCSANVHGQRLTLGPHQLVVPTILISCYLVSEQIHLIMVATSLPQLRRHQPHLLRRWLRLRLKPVLLWRLALRLLLLESALLLAKLILELLEELRSFQKCSDTVTYLDIFLISI